MSLLLYCAMEVPLTFSNEVYEEEKTDCDSDSVEPLRKGRDREVPADSINPSLVSSNMKTHHECSVEDLSPNRFAAYVKCLSFDDVADTISRECIDAECFLSMDNDDLNDLGVDVAAVTSIKASLRKHKQAPLHSSLSLPLPPSSKPSDNDRVVYGRLIVLGYKVFIAFLMYLTVIFQGMSTGKWKAPTTHRTT